MTPSAAGVLWATRELIMHQRLTMMIVYRTVKQTMKLVTGGSVAPMVSMPINTLNAINPMPTMTPTQSSLRMKAFMHRVMSGYGEVWHGLQGRPSVLSTNSSTSSFRPARECFEG